jgi:hypothetical protein
MGILLFGLEVGARRRKNMVEMPNDKLSAVRKSVRVEILGRVKAWELGMGTKMWTQDADGKPTLLGDVFSLFREIGAAVDTPTDDGLQCRVVSDKLIKGRA